MEDQTNDNVLPIQEIKTRAVRGVLALTSRSVVMGAISTVGFTILAILLDQVAFGIFALASAAINFLNYFSDIGLAGALIQKKTEPSRDDLVTTFTIQQILVASVVLIALFFSNTIAGFYQLPPDGIFLFKALAISFFLSSLKTIPSVLLERKLQFTNLIKPQIVETLIYYTVAIILAYKGFGVASYAWAALARGLGGVIAMYLIAPWRIGFGIKQENARHLLSFGIHFQLPSFLALVKDDLIFLFLGKLLPLGEIGYIGWAKRIVDMTLRQQIMDTIVRVTFPTFSRVQHDAHILSRAISRTLMFLAIVSFPVAIGMIFIFPSLVTVIPRFSKWEPAIPTLSLLIISFLMAMFSSPFYNALNALGQVKTTLKLMIFWTVLTWLIVPLFVRTFGFQGFAYAMVIINISSFLPLFILKKTIPFNFTAAVFKPAIATVFMALLVGMTLFLVKQPRVQLVSAIIVGVMSYSSLLYFLQGKELIAYIVPLLHKKRS